MRIVFVTAAPPGVPCGVADYTMCLAGALTASGEDVIVLRGAAGGANRLDRRDTVRIQPVVERWSLAGLSRLRALALAEDADIVHVQFPGRGYGRGVAPNLLPVVLRGRARPRVVTTVHEFAIAPLHGRLRILIGIWASAAVIVPDEQIQASLRRLIPRWPGAPTIARIPVGATIPAASTKLDRSSVRRRWRIPDGVLAVGWFGLLTVEKGARTAAAAFGRIVARRPAVFVLVGDVGDNAESREVLRGLRAQLGPALISPGVASAEDVAELLASLDVVVLPYRGGLTERRTSYLGVRAQGTPIVTTSPSMRGYEPGSNTSFVAPDDADQLADAVLAAPVRRRGGDAAEHRWAEIASAHWSLYQEILRVR